MGKDGLSFLGVSDLRASQAWSCQGASSYCLMVHLKTELGRGDAAPFGFPNSLTLGTKGLSLPKLI